MSASVLVWGAGGHGRVVADAARLLGHELIGYADADRSLLGSVVDARGGIVVFSDDDTLDAWLATDPARVLALGVGNNEVRMSFAMRIATGRTLTVIHPSATVAAGVRIGSGSVLLAGAVVNPGATIGRIAIVNTGAVIEHDVDIGDGAHVSPGAVMAGASVLGEAAWIGANAAVLPGVRVAARAVVGAGAVVLEDVPEAATVVGNPARRIR